MADPRDTLISPVLSEKANYLAVSNVYTFRVHQDATKPEVKSAVEDLFGVKVGKVNMLNRRGTHARSTRTLRIKRRPAYKRAMVEVIEGKIELFGT